MAVPIPSSTGRTIAITGASGLIGTALSEALRGRGDQVIHLVRRAPRALRPPSGATTAREVRWQPGHPLAPDALTDVDAVVHLAGAGIGDRRWSAARKAELLASRVDGTTTIAQAVAALPHRDNGPPRLLSASAVGYYGDRGSDILTEDSSAGDGFLAEVCQQWEAATAAAEEAGSPVAHLRTGIILSSDGGALAKLLPLARFGLAGPLGSGKQYWSWITLHDHVRAILFLLDDTSITGPVNLVGPRPATQTEVVKALAHALHRPALVPAPTPALRLVLGEMAGEILGSQRVLPAVLDGAGFRSDHADLPSAMAWVAQRVRGVHGVPG